jgi:hypothetical protein
MSDPERLFDSYSVDPEVRELVKSLRELSPDTGAGARSWGRMAAKVAALPVLATASSSASSSAAQVGSATKVGTVAAGISKALALKVVIGAVASTALGVGLLSFRHRDADVVSAPDRQTHLNVVSVRPSPATLDEPAVPQEAPAPVPERGAAAISASPATRRSALDAEASMLARVRSDLRGGDANAALAALNRLQSEFPRGQLTQERDVLAIEVLVANGNTAAARRKAQAFIAAHPKSPHSAKLERFVEAR